jgi:hypothetical protein
MKICRVGVRGGLREGEMPAVRARGVSWPPAPCRPATRTPSQESLLSSAGGEGRGEVVERGGDGGWVVVRDRGCPGARGAKGDAKASPLLPRLPAAAPFPFPRLAPSRPPCSPV